MHIVATPYRSPRRSSSFSKVAVTRAPVAPSGWPSEIPPPFGFTSPRRSCRPLSRMNWSATEANASFTSTTATSSHASPARLSAREHASGLPCSISRGSTPTSPKATYRARGTRPRREQAASLATSTAAAPSQIWLEFPAVTLPFGRNAGSSAASASGDVSARGVSSTPKSTPVCGFDTSTGTTSCSKRPSSIAASARRCDSYEYASSSSRERSHFSAISSAEMPCGTSSKRSSSVSERSPPLEPIGTRDIDSTPAATTTSSCPAETADAALNAACSEEPHWRSTVEPATDSGHPATSAAVRAMFQPCSPTCETQPICTSSTSAGSSPFRCKSALSTCPASSSARSEASVPFRLPIGERTASTIRASSIGDSVQPPFAGNALQLVYSALLELDARARDEVLDGLRDQHLPRPRQRSDARARVDREAAHLVAVELAFAGVDARADLEPTVRNRIANRGRTPDGAR